MFTLIAFQSFISYLYNIAEENLHQLDTVELAVQAGWMLIQQILSDTPMKRIKQMIVNHFQVR